MVFFEAARRLGATLAEMAEVFGAEREAAVAREIGKTYEEVVRASLGELGGALHRDAGARRDNAGGRRRRSRPGRAGTGRRRRFGDAPALTVEMLCEAGLSLKQASAVMARLGGRSRREVYQDASGLAAHTPRRQSRRLMMIWRFRAALRC